MLKHSGQIYELSPYALLWNSDCYYVLGYSESHCKLVKFRVDRMTTTKMTDISAVPKPPDFRIEEYAKSVFSMYDEEYHLVTLRCENSLMKTIIDRFGATVETTIADGEHFTVEVDVSVSPTFFGWVVGFGGRMQIVGPDDVKERYIELLKKLLSQADV